jgi:hypothetical protein
MSGMPGRYNSDRQSNRRRRMRWDIAMPTMLWVLSGFALFLSGCLAAPIAVEATVEVVTIALRATDPNYGSRVINQPTVAQQAQAKCAQNEAGPDTECVAYMTHMTGSYY